MFPLLIPLVQVAATVFTASWLGKKLIDSFKSKGKRKQKFEERKWEAEQEFKSKEWEEQKKKTEEADKKLKEESKENEKLNKKVEDIRSALKDPTKTAEERRDLTNQLIVAQDMLDKSNKSMENRKRILKKENDKLQKIGESRSPSNKFGSLSPDKDNQFLIMTVIAIFIVYQLLIKNDEERGYR